jgi:hypothetical protein
MVKIKENETEETISLPTRRARSTASRLAMVVLVLALLGALGAAGYFYKQVHDLKANPQKVSDDEAKSIIAAVGKLVELPTDETPTIATVTEPDKLKDQPFFAHAKAGDKVLIYNNAKKAILYDPVANKVIEVAPINFDNTASTNANTNKPTDLNSFDDSNTNSTNTTNTNKNTNTSTNTNKNTNTTTNTNKNTNTPTNANTNTQSAN